MFNGFMSAVLGGLVCGVLAAIYLAAIATADANHTLVDYFQNSFFVLMAIPIGFFMGIVVGTLLWIGFLMLEKAQ